MTTVWRSLLRAHLRIAAIVVVLAVSAALLGGRPARAALPQPDPGFALALGVSPDSGTVVLGQTLTFNYQVIFGSGRSAYEVELDFGDGNSDRFTVTLDAQASNPQNRFERPYVYQAVGTYNARLTVRLPGGLSNSLTTTVRVQQFGIIRTVGPVVATLVPATATVIRTVGPLPPLNGITVSVSAGWNLVGGPQGTLITGNTGPIYTFGPGDTEYRALPPGLVGAVERGGWVLFPAATTITLPRPVGLQTAFYMAPAGQFFMVGNPGITPAFVNNADAVFVFDTASNSYRAATTIPVGAGAWVRSNAGGPITVQSPAPMP